MDDGIDLHIGGALLKAILSAAVLITCIALYGVGKAQLEERPKAEKWLDTAFRAWALLLMWLGIVFVFNWFGG